MTMPGVRVRVRFASDPVIAENRKELAQAARDRMQELFEPIHTWTRVDPSEDSGIPT